MIVSLDIETQGLDATKFLLGCIIPEHTKKPEYFTTKESLWKRVLELAFIEAKRKRRLYVYSHNASYDTAGYVPINDPHLIFFCDRPLFWKYKMDKEQCKRFGLDPNKKEAEIIHFLDSMSLYRMALKDVGDSIDLPKIETPQELMDGDFNGNLDELKPYLLRDTEIVYKSVMALKKELKDHDINVRHLYSIQQVGINALMSHLEQQPNAGDFFWNIERRKAHFTKREHEIHEAYRGGRVQCFKLGKIENASSIDCNSLYPYALQNIPTVALYSERLHEEPLKKMDMNELLATPGISQVMITNEKDPIGLLPVRTTTWNHYITPGQTSIGTYTHIELKKALTLGYTIHTVKWSVLWKETENPFKNYITKLYNLKSSTDKPLQKYLYKMLMNSGIGKMAQYRRNQQIIMDDIELYQHYLNNNFKMLRSSGYNIFYQKKDIYGKHKPYYMPIIPTFVNAWSRCYMHDIYSKIGKDNLIYTDTDSIHFTGENPIPIGENIGEFKLEHENEPGYYYGNKTYAIGEKHVVGGVSKKDVTPEAFKNGTIHTQQQITRKTAEKVEDIGKFTKTIRNLNLQKELAQTIINLNEEEKLYVDTSIKDINFFLPYLEKSL